MKRNLTLGILWITVFLNAQEVPLPEHPNPIFQRAQWINLNGVGISSLILMM